MRTGIAAVTALAGSLLLAPLMLGPSQAGSAPDFKNAMSAIHDGGLTLVRGGGGGGGFGGGHGGGFGGGHGGGFGGGYGMGGRAFASHGFDWLTIKNQAESVMSDVRRIRSHPLIPGSVAIYGYIYDVKNGQLVEVPEATRVGQNR
jgi:hypothetical protein